MIIKKTPDQVEKMAAAGDILVRCLRVLRSKARPGITTAALDQAAERFITSQGGEPAFKGYRGFPGSICTSPNSMVVDGIEGARVGNHLGDISSAIQRRVELESFSIIRTLVGHGIGRDMHEDPQIPNYGEPGRGPELEEGMVLAIEPMVNAGGPLVHMGDDGWAVYSQDGSLASHFEFTVAITANGPRVLTPWHEEEPDL